MNSELHSTTFITSAGRWATEMMMRHGVSPQALKPCVEAKNPQVRANALLTRDSWEDFDRQVNDAAQERLAAVADLYALGLIRDIPNAMGRTILTYEKLTDMTPAEYSMDPAARTITSRREYTPVQLPFPVTHKDFDIGIREIRAHQDRGEPLDDSHIRNAGRMVAEGLEDLLLVGGPTFGGLPIYGYTTHPDRNTEAFGTNGAWSAAAKTGENILADVIQMITRLEADKYFGPYRLYISGAYSAKLGSDFKINSDKTIIQRLREIDSIGGIRYCDRLSAAVLLVQGTSDVVQWADGESIQTIMWDLEGGMKVAFKCMAMQIPIVKSDANGNSGICHMS